MTLWGPLAFKKNARSSLEVSRNLYQICDAQLWISVKDGAFVIEAGDPCLEGEPYLDQVCASLN